MKNKNIPTLSIIIPSYNEQERLPPFLKDLFLEFKNDKNIEIILVDDGSHIENFNKLSEEISKIKKYWIKGFKHIRYEKNRGKGGAIKFGLEDAKGDYFAFVDADGATPAYELNRCWKYLQENTNIDYLAGARIIMFGKKVEKSFKRHLSSRIFSTYFTLIFGIKMYDPQCGMKFFRRDLYNSVKEKITDNKWLWDTQLTILAHRLNKFKMIELPIDWKDVPGSNISLIKDSLKMFISLWLYRKIGK